MDQGNQIARASESVPEFAYVENEKNTEHCAYAGIRFVKNISKKTVAHRSNAEGSGITNVTVGRNAQFVLTTRIADGRQC